MDPSLPDRYQIEGSPVGEGRATRVVRARDRELDLSVAIAVLRADLAGAARMQSRFRREVERTGFVSHPGWLARHDAGIGPDGAPFVVTPLCGGSFARFRAAPPPWDELLRLLLEVVDGLAWYHGRGGVHANLKPEDLLLLDGPDGAVHARLADPHLGGVVAAVSGRRSSQGAPGYAAPEQKADPARGHARGVDLFSLGVVVWEIVTGALPFGKGRPGPEETALPPFVPRVPVPPRIQVLLSNLLHPSPLGRYDLVADVRTELLALGPPAANPEPGLAFRMGTVAAGFVPPNPFQTDETLDDTSFRGMTTEEVLSLAPWNRPVPPPIGPAPPAEPGLEGPCASLPVRVAREVPLVGRGGPLGALWAAARQVVERHEGTVVVVRGAAGAGRTRLIRSFTAALEHGGQAEAVWCRYAPDAPDQGTVGAARDLLRPDDGGTEDLVVRLRRRLLRERATGGREVTDDAAVLARWCGSPPKEDQDRSSGRPAQAPAPSGVAVNEIVRHLEARAWRGVGVLVLDDVQWARHDDGLAIAERLLDRVEDGAPAPPLLVVVSAAEEAIGADPELAGRLERLVSRGAARIDLALLHPAEADALVVATAPIDAAGRARVVERAEGRPWRVPQILRAWDEAGWLVGGQELALAPDIDPPPFDRAALRARIDRLAQATAAPKRWIDTVHLAALAGPLAPWGVVEPLAGELLADRVMGCELWIVHEGTLRFVASELHEWLIADAVERPDLAYLHRRIGRAWDRARPADPGPSAAFRAGRHAAEAGDRVFAVRALTDAAERAWASGAEPTLVRAAELAERAAASDGLEEALRGSTLLWKGRAEEVRARFPEASERFEAARVALEAADDPEGALAAALGLGWCRVHLGEIEAADWLFSEIVGQARQRELLRPEALAMAGRAAIAERKRAFDQAEQDWGRVVTRTARLSDLRFAGEALLGHADLARRRGRFDEADELYHEAATAFRDGLDPVGLLRAEIGVATALRHRRPDAAAEDRLIGCLGAADGYGVTPAWTRIWLGLADLARHRDDPDRAQVRYGIASDWAARLGSFELSVGVALGRAQLALGRGDLGGAYEQTRKAADWLDQRPGHPLWAPYRLVVAALLAHRRDHTQTWQWLWSAQEVGVADGADRDVAVCLAAICEVAADAGWGNVLRLAGKLGAEQLVRLKDEAGASRLEQRVASALL